MYNFIGFIISIAFVKFALGHLSVNTSFFVDVVALLVVFGGTFGVMVISFPPKFLFRFFTAPMKMIVSKSPNFVQAIESLIKALQDDKDRKHNLKKLSEQKNTDTFLKEGIELYLMDMPLKDFKNIMTERIYRSRQREEDNINLFRRLAKYPPAFGLVGTVLGLISLMRSVGEGANASTIGLNMALALTATLYGLAFSNFVLAPIAENFQSVADEKKVFQELLLEGLLLCYDGSSPLTVQEMLNSYVEPHKRIDILGVNQKESA